MLDRPTPFARVCAAGLLGLLLVSGRPHAAPHASLGTNLVRIDEWSPQIAFVDAFRASGPWVSGTTSNPNDGRALDLDAHDWVRSLQSGQIATSYMFTSPSSHYPSGRYTVTYEGEGSLTFSSNARVVERQAGQQVLDVDASRGALALVVTATNPQNYLRNIHVRMPNAATDETFTPALIDTLRGYAALRFMDWLDTNGNWSVNTPNTQRTWADRPTLEDARWSRMHGVPIEVMIALANRLGTDAWFNIPHQADDDYVRRFAQLVRSQLDPRLKVYVEYSNEVWNGGYAQAFYAQNKGLEAGLSTNAFQAQVRWYARRSREVFVIWEREFPADRLVRVLASQHANPWVSEQELGFEDTAFHTDALAVAPYFSHRPVEQEAAAAMSLDGMFADINQNLLPRLAQAMRLQADVAARARVPLIAYEGGQEFVAQGPFANDSRLNGLYDSVNRDPRIGPVYTRFLQDWSDAGGGLFMNFTHCALYNANGRFGALEWLEQPRQQAPKYDALLTWMGR